MVQLMASEITWIFTEVKRQYSQNSFLSKALLLLVSCIQLILTRLYDPELDQPNFDTVMNLVGWLVVLGLTAL